MKKSFTLLISFILLTVFVMLIIIILLLIELISIHDVSYTSIIYPSTSHSLNFSGLDTYSFVYERKNSIFNPFIDLFYKNNYYPSHFIKTDTKLSCLYNNISLSNIICNKQYSILDRTCNSINELSNDLAMIIKEYKNE
jgi:hypothetical protein